MTGPIRGGLAMILGFSPFTWVHTLLSIVALIAGYVVVRDLFSSRIPEPWTGIYIATAVLTSATGFGFSFPFGASHVVGIISLAILAGVIAAYYGFHLAGPWRPIYAAGQVLVLYFLVFVLVAQFFKKIPAMTALAPTLSEPPFAIAQTVVLVVFAVLTYTATRRFNPR
jgi:hypothetical protein